MNIHSTGMNTYIILKNNWCENMRKKYRDGFGTFVSEPKFTVGFFIRRPGFRVDNNNKLLCQFLQVTFGMLQMSQVHLTFLLRQI